MHNIIANNSQTNNLIDVSMNT